MVCWVHVNLHQYIHIHAPAHTFTLALSTFLIKLLHLQCLPDGTRKFKLNRKPGKFHPNTMGFKTSTVFGWLS